MTRKTDDKKLRAKRTDIEAANERFDGIFRVATNANMTNENRLDIIAKIAKGMTLNEVTLEAGRMALGLEANTEVAEA